MKIGGKRERFNRRGHRPPVPTPERECFQESAETEPNPEGSSLGQIGGQDGARIVRIPALAGE